MPTTEITLPYNFTTRPYQKEFWAAAKRYQYLAIVWARRHGKDINCWNYAIDRASREPMEVRYVFPTSDMATDNLWRAITNDGIPFTDYVPMALRRRRNRGDDGLNDSDRHIELVNGSIISLKSGDRPDRLRGGNPKLFILSEFSEQDPRVLDIIEPIVEANGGQVIINMTPKGDNHARGSWESWQADPTWWTQMITARDTNVFTPEQLERIRLRLVDRFVKQGRSATEARSFFEQEYLCSFDSPVVGAYYADQLRQAQEDGRISNVPHETDLPVDTVWDLGIDDSMAIWFVQAAGRELRLIDYYENSGEGLNHYAQVLREKRYTYGRHFAPHDIRVRELGTGVSRLETAAKLGINFQLAPKLSVDDGIHAARMILSRCWFDKTKCERGLSALKNYHKEYDEKNKVYSSHPKHDWSSHGADAFRYFATSYKQQISGAEPPKDDIPAYARVASLPASMAVNAIRRR